MTRPVPRGSPVGLPVGHRCESLVFAWFPLSRAVAITRVRPSTQITLFVAPVLVFVGLFTGTGLDLVFSEFEVIALAKTVLTVRKLTYDGESHWMEGVMLVAVYGIFAIGLFFL